MSSATVPVRMLLQRPGKWTAMHLAIARVLPNDNVTAKEMLGPQFVPKDGDPGTKILISD